MSEQRYIDDVLEGRALLCDITDYVEKWHQARDESELHEYLGLSWDEYRLWVERPESLRLIVGARELDEPVEDMLARQDDHALAARNLDPRDARTVREWLIATGRLPRR
jgi:hypothetical protein